jgi:ABC-type transport system involved in cytochrome bd biosynthesis fused ATPase/permease subunit
MASARARGPTQRLLTLPATRRLTLACAVLGVMGWALIVTQWTLVAAFVAAVFLRDATPGDVVGLLAAALLAWLARSGLLAVRDLLAARASSRVRRDAREALARKLLRLGPDLMTGERAGELPRFAQVCRRKK